MNEIQREDYIIGSLRIIELQTDQMISLSSLLRVMYSLNKKYNLNYHFSDKYYFSTDLILDLKKLTFSGIINQYRSYDRYIPKKFIKLSTFGRGKGNALLENIPDEIKKNIEETVKQIIQES